MSTVYMRHGRGVGEIVAAAWPIPQNPIRSAADSRFNVQATGMGQFMPASWTLPMNPIAGKQINGTAGVSGLGMGVAAGLAGCGCGCGGKDRYGKGVSGLGALDFSSVGAALDSDVAGIPVLWLLGGAAFAYLLLGTRSNSAEYNYKAAQLKRKYPRRGRALQERFAS